MTRKLKLETLANILIVVASLVCIAAIGSRLLVSRPVSKKPINGYQLGDRLSAAEVPVDFSKSPQTLLLVMSSHCQYCIASIPFYRDLVAAESTSRPETRIVAIGLLEKADSLGGFLRRNGVTVDEVITINPKNAKFSVTPTMVLIDQTGLVKGVWTGLLSTEADQKNVLKLVATGHV